MLEYEFVVDSPVSLHHAADAVVGKAVAKEFVILPARIRNLQRNLLHRELFLLRRRARLRGFLQRELRLRRGRGGRADRGGLRGVKTGIVLVGVEGVLLLGLLLLACKNWFLFLVML